MDTASAIESLTVRLACVAMFPSLAFRFPALRTLGLTNVCGIIWDAPNLETAVMCVVNLHDDDWDPIEEPTPGWNVLTAVGYLGVPAQDINGSRLLSYEAWTLRLPTISPTFRLSFPIRSA